MANATPSRLGQSNSVGGSYANDNSLFLKKFGGEVMAAFAEANVMRPLHLVRSIENGKSAQFPATWKAASGYHTPGAELNGGQIIAHNERVITIDDLLLADTFIAEIDELKNHYDVREIYARELGYALARTEDKQLLQTAVLAARAATTVTGGFAGTALTAAGYGTTAATLIAGIFAAAQTLDEKDVPEHDRFIALKPAQYYLLVQGSTAQNRDYAGSGSIQKGTLPEVAGISLVKTNHLPTSIIAAVTGEQNTYSGTFTTTVGVAWQRTAIGTVKLRDLKMESEYQIQRQGTLMVAKMLVGHGILRPECAVELKTA